MLSVDGNRKIEDSKPRENLKQRAYLNSVTSVLDYGARIVTNFFVTPFLVSGLGSTLFGAWKVLGQFTSYTNLADIKATQVLKWAVAKDRDSISDEELREYVTATFFLVMMILPLLLVAGAVISWYSPRITNVPAEYYATVRITSSILVLALVTNKVFDLFESILRGMNLGFKRMGFRATVFVIGGGLQVAVVLYEYGLIGLALVQVLVNLIIGITIYVIVKKNVPWYGWGKVNIKRSFSFFKTSGWFMGWAGIKMLILNSDKVLLGFLSGPALVTQYVITEYFMKAANGTIANVVHGVIPGIGKLYGSGHYEKLYKAREHIMLLTWIIGGTIGTVVILLNESFIHLWIGSNQFAGQTVNILIVLVVFQYMFIQNDSSIINTTLDLKQKVYIGLVSAAIMISCIFLLVPEYGIAGLCIALLAGRAVMSIGYPWIISKKLNISAQLMVYVRPGVVLAAMWVASYKISGLFSLNTWLELIFAAAVSMAVILLITSVLGLNRSQRAELAAYGKRIKLFKSE